MPMHSRLLLALAVIGCSPTQSSTPASDTAPVEPERRLAGSCQLASEQGEAPTLHPQLRDVAAQYFHAPHRGGFDAYTGGDTFPWFDIHDLAEPFVPPPQWRIAASTERWLVAADREGQLGIQGRQAGPLHHMEHRLYPEEAVEGPGRTLWILARSGSTWRVVYIDTRSPAYPRTVFDLGVPESVHDVRLATAGDGTPGVAWLEREEGRLAVSVGLLDPEDGVQEKILLDEVTVPARVAELTERTSVSLALVGHGADGLAVMWRPLVDRDYDDFGDRSKAPETKAAAEFRWRTRAGDGELSEVRRRPAWAQPLGFYTGAGPWPLRSAGIKAGRLEGRGMFAWLGEREIEVVLADDDVAVSVGARDGDPLIAFRDGGGGTQMLLFDASPRVRAIDLRCRP